MSPMKSRYSVILEYLKMIEMLIIMKNYIMLIIIKIIMLIITMTICVHLCGSGDVDNDESDNFKMKDGQQCEQ